ncbi:MAG: hypothetical protein ACOYB1_10540 [Limnohabitans sp.]
MKFLIALIAGFIAFTGWMRMVGNPHVVETVIGLVLAAAVFFFILIKI